MKQSFEEIVEKHGGTVLRVCRVIVGIHDAEDAWSETLLAALHAYPDLPDGASADVWLIMIAHCTAADVLSARKHQPAPAGQVPAVSGDPGEEDGDLWRAVAALPDKQRQAMAYHYVAGLAHAEVAGILGGTPGAARRAAADGARNLRKNYPGTATEGASS
jgi:RNA polymerase sigma factor (sigma-70 family)